MARPELRHLLKAVFADADAASEWLHTPLPALRGRTPMTLIRSGELRQIVGLLAGLEAGAFA